MLPQVVTAVNVSSRLHDVYQASKHLGTDAPAGVCAWHASVALFMLDAFTLAARCLQSKLEIRVQNNRQNNQGRADSMVQAKGHGQ